MRADIRLDSSQESVASAGPEERQFVVAAAGQGKTEVLLERIKSLRADGLNPADEVLVLSFSRAAVEAVRKRSAQHGSDGVSILTFDSFASRLIIDEGVDRLEGSFDQRIRQATELIASDDMPALLEPIRHVLIDEAQDVVGDRAELVLALLTTLDGMQGDELGFTVLGDPLQGIYDFQLDESVSKMTSRAFVGELRERLGAQLKQLEFHYRATSPQMKDLIRIADEIRGLDGKAENAPEAHKKLDSFLQAGPVTSNFLNEGAALEPADDETTAVLASTNYEVLIASELLWGEGLSHVVRRRAQDMSVAPWVYAVFKDLESRSYPEQVVLEKLASAGLEAPEDRWLDLKTAEGDFQSHSSLHLGRLGTRLRTRSVPISLTVQDHHQLTVSTVHRSKGLEFTNVLYLPPGAKMPAGKIDWSTLRQKYVALSRARELLISAGFPENTIQRSSSDAGGARALELWWKRGIKSPRPGRMEFANGDIDDLVPFSSTETPAMDAQNELQRPDLLGLPVIGELDTPSVRDGVPPRYLLITESGNAIGRTSTGFGYALKKHFLSRSDPKWPVEFTGARVTALETATGFPEETMISGLGPSGMWLVPRLTGLIRPIWKKD